MTQTRSPRRPHRRPPHAPRATLRLALGLLALIPLWMAAPSSALASGFCTQAAKAKQADPKDPYVMRALKVWRDVSSPLIAMTGRQTGLVILADGAGAPEGAPDHAQAFKAAGVTCPGAPPVVYITWPLLKLVYEQQRYSEGFLAFVMGHELGHRVNDLDIAGALTGAAPGKEHIEALADKRAAFYMALAGYSASELARADAVTAFLESEHRAIPRAVLEQRRAALLETLTRFDAYENLYTVGLALASSREEEAAERLLAMADELTQGQSVPLPELKLLRAWALLHHAAADAPWLSGVSDALPEARALRCVPIFASYTSLSDEAQASALRGNEDIKSRQEASIARLKLAQKLLDQAEDYLADPALLSHARACLTLYQGLPEQSARHLADAVQRAQPKPATAITRAVAHNRALITLSEHLRKQPVPAPSDVKRARAWAAQLRALHKKLKPDDPALRLAMTRWAAYPDPDVQAKAQTQTKAKSQAPTCELPRPVLVPEPSGHDLGVCPEGWSLLHTLPSARSADAAQTTLGVTTCAQAVAGQPSRRFVRVRLPGSMAPALAPLHMTLVIDQLAADARHSAAR